MSEKESKEKIFGQGPEEPEKDHSKDFPDNRGSTFEEMLSASGVEFAIFSYLRQRNPKLAQDIQSGTLKKLPKTTECGVLTLIPQGEGMIEIRNKEKNNNLVYYGGIEELRP